MVRVCVYQIMAVILYTFTTIKDVEDLSICEPSKEYLEVINKGKRDAFKSGANVVVL